MGRLGDRIYAYEHLMLEMYCECPKEKDRPLACINQKSEIGMQCLEEHCRFLSYTSTNNENVYIGQNGVVAELEDWIGFGGEMEPEDVEEYEASLLK